MSSEKLLQELHRYVLPAETVGYFEIVDLQESEGRLHFYLDEHRVIQEEYSTKELSPNGFYEDSTIKDFSLRDRKVVLHVRRRWVDLEGTSYSRRWDLVAEGTRYSTEVAFFFKDAFGYLPDTSPIS